MGGRGAHQCRGGDAAAYALVRRLQAAGRSQADVQLVIPTRVGFRDSIGQALAIGTYGARSELEPRYFAHVRAYVDAAVQAAEQEGVRVSRRELGNEFWGSDEMSASEYGYPQEGEVAQEEDTAGRGDAGCFVATAVYQDAMHPACVGFAIDTWHRMLRGGWPSASIADSVLA